MRKITSTSLFLISLVLLSCNAFGQNGACPFEIRVSGQGDKPLIFIPGFGCSGDVWNDIRPAYEKDFTCYTLTMAGFAGVPAEGQPSFRNWEKAIAGYIRDQKMPHPILIGHSMGGGLAMALAADYPDLTSGIIVVDALPCLSALMDPSFKSKENNDCGPSVSQLVAMPDDQFLSMQKSGLPRLMADTSKIPLVAGWALRSDRRTFAEMYCDFSNTDLREKIKTIRCPALILLESYFVNLKPAISAQFKNLKTADLRYATKGLHFIMYDDREWLDKEIHNFVSGQ